jgi:hypothetical protein
MARTRGSRPHGVASAMVLDPPQDDREGVPYHAFATTSFGAGRASDERCSSHARSCATRCPTSALVPRRRVPPGPSSKRRSSALRRSRRDVRLHRPVPRSRERAGLPSKRRSSTLGHSRRDVHLPRPVPRRREPTGPSSKRRSSALNRSRRDVRLPRPVPPTIEPSAPSSKRLRHSVVRDSMSDSRARNHAVAGRHGHHRSGDRGAPGSSQWDRRAGDGRRRRAAEGFRCRRAPATVSPARAARGHRPVRGPSQA